MKYVAFLLGINVGKRQAKMIDLQKCFEGMDMKHVKTLLVSGNVLFETDKTNLKDIKDIIEKNLLLTFGFEIKIILYTFSEIEKLVASNPFQKVEITPDTGLYVTFLGDASHVGLISPNKPLDIIQTTSDYVCWAITRSQSFKTPDMMTYLMKTLGKYITTRNWNTIVKIVNSSRFIS